MNATVWLTRLLTVGAGLEGLAGLGLLVAPSELVAVLLGSPLDGNGVVVAHLAGGGLLGLGVVCWSARHTPSAPAGLGASWALILYNIVACVTLAGTRPAMSGRGLLVVGAAALHGLLWGGLLTALVRQHRQQPAPLSGG